MRCEKDVVVDVEEAKVVEREKCREVVNRRIIELRSAHFLYVVLIKLI